MSIFQEVAVPWEGKQFKIPPRDVLRCIAAVEGVITLGELATVCAGSSLPLARLAMAFGIILRFAGADASDEDVYDHMFKDAGKEMQDRAIEASFVLHRLMVPPEHMRAAEEKVAAGKKVAGEAKPPGASSSTATG